MSLTENDPLKTPPPEIDHLDVPVGTPGHEIITVAITTNVSVRCTCGDWHGVSSVDGTIVRDARRKAYRAFGRHVEETNAPETA